MADISSELIDTEKVSAWIVERADVEDPLTFELIAAEKIDTEAR